MNRFKYILLLVPLLLILGSCEIRYNENEESIKEYAPKAFTEQWAADYHSNNFDTLYIVHADVENIKHYDKKVVLYDKDLNKKYVVKGGSDDGTIFIFGLVVALIIVFVVVTITSD